MKNDENIAARYAPDDADKIRNIAGPLKRLAAQPLLPEAGASGAPLTAVIGVISFLAAIALAAFLMTATAVSTWTGALNASFTIQVKGDDPASIDATVSAVTALLESTDGVISQSITPPSEAAKLLEPWLGKNNISDYLNVPALIDVKAMPVLMNDLELLEQRLAMAAPNAMLDDHSTWRNGLSATARSGQILAFVIFLLILGAACAIAIFAARAGLAANQDVVSLLHLVGATDEFIANEVQRRFVILGLRGSFSGLFLAFLVIAVLALIIGADPQRAYFLPGFEPSLWLGSMLFAVPLTICLVTAIAARVTVIRQLRTVF